MGPLGCALLLVVSFPSTPETFRAPILKVNSEGRVQHKLIWASSKWDPSADRPFAAIAEELKPYRNFAGFDKTGKWAVRAKTAYNDWFNDCQDPVKLYRATAYFGILKEVDSLYSRSKESRAMWENLHLGWLIIKSPPKSYLFARQGYRACAGDGQRLLYGDLCRRLLERDPLDRAALCAGIAELWDERVQRDAKGRVTQLAGKGESFEATLIKASTAIRKTEAWRPWDDSHMARLYFVRASRTLRYADCDKAVEFHQRAEKAMPAEFDASASMATFAGLLSLLRDEMKYK